MIKKERCVQCHSGRLEGPRTMYCSFRCSYDYGMRLAQYDLGPDNTCFIDGRIRITAGPFVLNKRVAAWYLKTGVIVRGTDLINTCSTIGCTNPDHFEDKNRKKRIASYQEGNGSIESKNNHNVTMYINGEEVIPKVYFPVVGLKPGFEKMRLSYTNNNDSFSVIIDIPDGKSIKRTS